MSDHPRMTFTQEFQALVDRIGVDSSAKVIGVTPRSIRRWYQGYSPTKPTQIGALSLLKFELLGKDIISAIRSRKNST